MIAAIIKHMYREKDYRVDLFPDDTTPEEIVKHYDLNLLGPFELVCVTERVSETSLKKESA